MSFLARKTVSRLVVTSRGSLATRLFKATVRRRRWRQASGRESRPKVEKEAVVVRRCTIPCLLEPRNGGGTDEEGYKEAHEGRRGWEKSGEIARGQVFPSIPADPSSNLLSNDSSHHFLFLDRPESPCGNFIYPREISIFRVSRIVPFLNPLFSVSVSLRNIWNIISPLCTDTGKWYRNYFSTQASRIWAPLNWKK